MERTTPYFESQVGGNCRIHATNMLLGKRVNCPKTFAKLAKSFETFYGTEASVEHDYVQEDGVTLADYVTEKSSGRELLMFGLTEYSPFDLFGAKDAADFAAKYADPDSPGALVFHADHVWTLRRQGDDDWYVLDSQGGRPRKARYRDSPYEALAGRHASLAYTRRGGCRILIPLLQAAMRAYIEREAKSSLSKRLLDPKTKRVTRDISAWASFFGFLVRKSKVNLNSPPSSDAAARLRVHAVLGDLLNLLARFIRVIYWCAGKRKDAERLGTLIRLNHPRVAQSLDRMVVVYHGVLGSILGHAK